MVMDVGLMVLHPLLQTLQLKQQVLVGHEPSAQAHEKVGDAKADGDGTFAIYESDFSSGFSRPSYFWIAKVPITARIEFPTAQT